MTERKVETVVETKEHSFENVLDVPKGSTEITTTKVSSNLKDHVEYDEKDSEIEEDFAEVQDKAFELFEYLMDEIEDADPNKRARIAEVAGKVLDSALSAADKRRALKEHVDKLTQKERQLASGGKTGGKTNNNIFIGTHEDMMKRVEEALNLDDKSVDDDNIIEYDGVEENTKT